MCKRPGLRRARPPPSLFLALPRCCQTHDNCYTQAKKLKDCKVLIDNPYTNSYSFTCSGNVVTCSGRFTLGALWTLLGLRSVWKGHWKYQGQSPRLVVVAWSHLTSQQPYQAGIKTEMMSQMRKMRKAGSHAQDRPA